MKTDTESFKIRFRKYLKTKGCSIITQREAILEHLVNESTHFNADYLILALQKKDLFTDSASVYQTLSHLENAGIIRKLAFSTAYTHYELIRGEAPHEHFICSLGGTIPELPDSQLEHQITEIASRYSFTITGQQVQLYGICRSCGEY